MKSRVVFFIGFLSIFLATGLEIDAQTGPQLVKVAPPSPNVQALQKYGEIPVSAYTGIPSISVPIYTIKFRDITVPVSLSYHASGIKVGEEASRVGLGWSLNAGGVVSRTIMGGDDFETGYFSSNIPDFDELYFPKQFVQKSDPCNIIVMDHYNETTLSVTNEMDGLPYTDFEPDQYYFNFANQSGKFILKKDKSTAVLEKKQNLKISLLTSPNDYWRITDVDGFIYDFEAIESYHPNNDPLDHKSAWYLTKITSPAGNIVTFSYTIVASNYIQSFGSYTETKDVYQTPGFELARYQFSEQKGMAPGRNYTQVLLSSIDFTTGVMEFTYSTRDDVENDKKVDKIAIYSKDAGGNKSSNPIKFFDLGYTYFDGGYDNDYGPNPPQPATGFYAKRLKLTGITEKGYDQNGLVVSNNPYSFIYNESGNLPAKTSFARDHWGYFNGKHGNISLIPDYILTSNTEAYDQISYVLGTQGQNRDADNSPDLDFMKVFSLKTIQYPTGGSTEFVYEANDFDEQASQINDQSYFAKQYSVVVHNDANDMTYDNLYNGGAWRTSNVKDLTDLYLFSSNQLAFVQLTVPVRFGSNLTCPFVIQNGAIKFSILDEANNIIYEKDLSGTYKSDDSSLICQGSAVTFKTNLYLTPGLYTIQVSVNNSLFPTGITLQDMRFNFNWYSQVSSNPLSLQGITFSNAGGLRVKRIIDHDGLNPTNDKIKRFIYHYWEDRNGTGLKEYSYGKRMSRPEYRYFIPSEEFHHSRDPGNGNDIVQPFWTYHLMRNSDSNIPLNGSAAGAVVGYDTVVVLDGENGEFGKTVYAYHNNPDIVGNYSFDGLPIMPPSGSNTADPLNGSLLDETVYKANTQNNPITYSPVQTTSNTYNIGVNPSYICGLMWERITYVNAFPSSMNTNDYGVCSGYMKAYRTLNPNFSYLSSTTKKIYDPNDKDIFLSSTTNYFYEGSQHYFPTRTVTQNSLGENITTHTTYPLDFTSPYVANGALGIQNLKNKNVVNVPIEVYTDKSNTDINNPDLRTLSAVLSSYATANTLPKPNLLYALTSSTPVSNFSPISIKASGLHIDDSYKAAIFFDSYDVNGNIIQQRKDKDVGQFYIWDYKNSLPVAECVFPAVSNVSQLKTDIAYTSFEGDGTGNFDSYSGVITPVILTDDYNGMPPTGKKYYNLTGSNVLSKSGITNGKEYVVSYWSNKTTPYTLSGVINASYKTGRIFNTSWIHYEHTVTASGNTITISGTGKLDEVRIYPLGAQMTTYTYEPIIGVTSVCDANNKIAYYLYDGLSRLSSIRDQNKNIIKTFRYYQKGNVPNDALVNDCAACTVANGSKKCMGNGYCETGVRTNTSARWVNDHINQDGSIGAWKCTYYYVFSDNSHSGPNSEYSVFTPCDIDYVP
ncbi:hypothetical protein [Limnovirga soli]|uniref:YD repeat-containing protein n=1 Tax=Limnovirga soli TaxID=2656915 RepID=A0A8J8FHD5_9BACT|nr:hypothetical protein [Limnovirga soli]NNV55074.1 hypothetical protein [Limnovirga soli]